MDYTVDKIVKYLKKNLGLARFRHTIGTCRTAMELAGIHGAAMDKTILAALLHDAAKGLNNKKLVDYAKKFKISAAGLDGIIKHNPSLLHSYVSARIAGNVFGIRDREVLNAIALHTLAGPRMGVLAKIIYLADMTAPDRRYPKLKKLRNISRQDLDKAMHEAVGSKISYVISKGSWLHPSTLKAWNAFSEKINAKA